MKKYKEFFITCFAYLTVTVLDLVFTYIATPNLLLEGNPLFNNLDFGWSGMIILNAVTLTGYCIMSYYAFIKYKPPVTDETDMKKYLAYINYGDSEKYVPMMWKLPKNWGPQTACLCWSVVCVLPFCRMVVVIEWFLMILNIKAPIFFTIVSIFPLGRIDIFLAIIGAWILSFIWIKKEFIKNLAEINSRNENNV